MRDDKKERVRNTAASAALPTLLKTTLAAVILPCAGITTQRLEDRASGRIQ